MIAVKLPKLMIHLEVPLTSNYRPELELETRLYIV